MIEINGYSRTCGLIGNPVEHTMSPVIHNNLAVATNENLVYVPFHVETGRLEDAVKGAFGLNLLGVNVTVPYKSDVIPFLTDIDPLAKRIGAVNTLVRMENGFKGYNTDMPGLLRAMKKDGVEVKDEHIILLGAGGVARAVAMLLADNGASKIYILNRTTDKAQAIADEINSYKCSDIVEVKKLSDYSLLPQDKKYLAIQATSVGMYPKVDEAVIEDAAFYNMLHTGYDLIFNPLETKFMKLAKQSGAKGFHGYRMLLYQGVIAYELWTGKDVPDELAEQVYEKMLAAMNA